MKIKLVGASISEDVKVLYGDTDLVYTGVDKLVVNDVVEIEHDHDVGEIRVIHTDNVNNTRECVLSFVATDAAPPVSDTPQS